MRSERFVMGIVAFSRFGVAVNVVFPGLGLADAAVSTLRTAAPIQEGRSSYAAKCDRCGPGLTLRTDASFLDWLLEADNQDADENPRTKRGDEFCVVNFESDGVSQVWRDRPTFVIQGSPRSLALYRDTAQDPIWEYPVNEITVVVYTGPPLEPDTTYTLRARHPDFPSSIYEQRELQTVSFEEEVKTAVSLFALENESRTSGEDSETAIAIARADYFWQQGLETDAWATLWPLQAESSEVAEAISISTDRLCNLAPDFGTNLE